MWSRPPKNLGADVGLDKDKAKIYFCKLLKKLNLPKIKVIFRSASNSCHPTNPSVGHFQVGKAGPYIVLWKEGMTKRVIRHEIIHYIQYLIHGNRIWTHTKTLYGDGDHYEWEAEALEGLTDKNLKKYVHFRFSLAEEMGGSSVLKNSTCRDRDNLT